VDNLLVKISTELILYLAKLPPFYENPLSKPYLTRKQYNVRIFRHLNPEKVVYFLHYFPLGYIMVNTCQDWIFYKSHIFFI